jgi:hypothetical protein
MITAFERNGGYILQTDQAGIYQKLKKNLKRVTYCRDEMYYNSFLYTGIIPEARRYIRNLAGGPIVKRGDLFLIE